MESVNEKDASFSVPLHPEHQKHLFFLKKLVSDLLCFQTSSACNENSKKLIKITFLYL